jgi:hypothetical protein
MEKFDQTIGFFRKKRHFFRQKLAKIAENCDQNIDPRYCTKIKSPMNKKAVLKLETTVDA